MMRARSGPGGTQEAIDPVRYISNRSSGKMGAALAEAAWRRGATVSVVAGPLEVDLPAGIEAEHVESTAEMSARTAQCTVRGECASRSSRGPRARPILVACIRSGGFRVRRGTRDSRA